MTLSYTMLSIPVYLRPYGTFDVPHRLQWTAQVFEFFRSPFQSHLTIVEGAWTQMDFWTFYIVFSIHHLLRHHHPVAVAIANQTHSGRFLFFLLNTSVSNPPVQFWYSHTLWRCCCPQRWLECCHWHPKPGWWLGRDSPNEGYLKMDTKYSFEYVCFSLVFSSVTRMI